MFRIEVWAFYSDHVCYATQRHSIANTGEKMKHLGKNHSFIKTIATTKSSIKSLKMNFFTHFSFIMFKTYLYIVFCQKLKIEKKYFLSHFGHYLISACREIRLVLVRWVTNQLGRAQKG